MKIFYSPLVAGLRGKAADAVASSWKGIDYVRKWVRPANPQTAAQTAVRESFARCIPLWRSLDSHPKTYLDKYGTDYQMSGMNVFVQKCRALEQAAALIKPMPDHPLVPAPSTLVFATGAGASGDIDVTWVDNAPEDYDAIFIVARLASGNIFNFFSYPASNLGAYTITGLVAGENYDCYAWYWNDTPNDHGTSDGDLAIASKA